MEVIVCSSYADLSLRASEDLIRCMASRKDPLLCAASGDSPSGLYKDLVAKVGQKQLDISGWAFLGLDEWVGMNGSDEGSCRYHLNRELFSPLHVPDDRLFFFDGRAANLESECREAESFILRHGDLDATILGLGLNGHVGMNEPGTSVSSRTHVTALDPITAQTGQKYFKEAQSLTEGITLGLGTLLDSRNIFLLVSGAKKASIVKSVLEGEISEKVPASMLRGHPGLRIYLDSEAAGLLKKQ
ncbi:glucosamine-6-phosphate deaminase [Puia sp.]|jgi:galactosamine-6-phosphate isomerase|uniref:6-phosphogluconolactonase n=1 Tax=Puia sp. TaxID=2045100 RepID=UPI002F418E4D